MQSVEFHHVVPDMQKCYELLLWLEEAFDVSIKFWISIEQPPGARVDYWLYAGGAGDLFDRLPAGLEVFKSRILQAEGGSIYQPLWATLTHMESAFSALQRPKLVRPSL